MTRRRRPPRLTTCPKCGAGFVAGTYTQHRDTDCTATTHVHFGRMDDRIPGPDCDDCRPIAGEVY